MAALRRWGQGGQRGRERRQRCDGGSAAGETAAPRHWWRDRWQWRKRGTTLQRRRGRSRSPARPSPQFPDRIGNDLAGEETDYDHAFDGAYTLGVTMDITTRTSSCLPGEGGWPEWNAGGTFVTSSPTRPTLRNRRVMFDVYGMAGARRGERRRSRRRRTWYRIGRRWRCFFERGPRRVRQARHRAPRSRFWGFQQQQSGGDPHRVGGSFTTTSRVATIT